LAIVKFRLRSRDPAATERVKGALPIDDHQALMEKHDKFSMNMKLLFVGKL